MSQRKSRYKKLDSLALTRAVDQSAEAFCQDPEAGAKMEAIHRRSRKYAYRLMANMSFMLGRRQ